MTDDIKLNFINRSNGPDDSPIVAFPQNAAIDFAEIAVAWSVVRDGAPGENQPFVFPINMRVAPPDDYGNYAPQLDATHVLGSLPRGPINAGIDRVGPQLAPPRRTVVPVGAVVAYAGPLDTPDQQYALAALGWMPCDGRSLAVAEYPELFVALGQPAGATFSIPDYRAAAVAGGPGNFIILFSGHAPAAPIGRPETL